MQAARAFIRTLTAYVSFDILVLVISLGAVFVTWRYSDGLIQSQLTNAFHEEANSAVRLIEQQLEAVDQVAYGLKALHQASDEVTRDEYMIYMRGLDLEALNLGILGTSRVDRVPLANKDAFVESVRQDTSVNPPGYSDFAITPPGVRDEYAVVNFTYQVGQGSIDPVGVDIYADPAKAEAVQRARDTGEIAVSSVVPIYISTDAPPIDGLLFSLPLYKNASDTATLEMRQQSHIGFINALFIPDNFFKHALSEGLARHIAFSVSDTTGEKRDLFSDSRMTEDGGSHLSPIVPPIDHAIDIGGRKWTFTFRPTKEYISDAGNTEYPLFVLVGGVIVSFLLFAFFYILSSANAHANSLVEERTSQLQKFMLAVENASNHIVITDPDGKILYANKSVERITGYTVEEVIGQSPKLWGGLMGKSYYEAMWRTIKEQHTSFHGEVRNKRKNGEMYYALLSISPIMNESGAPLGFVGVEEDISKLKEQEQKIQERSKDLERMNQLMIGRELRMAELKKIIENLQNELHPSEGKKEDKS